MDQVVKRVQNSQAPVSSPNEKRRRPKLTVKKIVGIVVVVLILLAAIIFQQYMAKSSGFAKDIKKDQYQAVFLTNGQVYFGKINKLTSEGYALNDIYYLQVKEGEQAATQQPADENQNVSLAKLGSELHGPDDAMYIEAKQVLFWENLKNDSQVVKAIQQDKNK